MACSPPAEGNATLSKFNWPEVEDCWKAHAAVNPLNLVTTPDSVMRDSFCVAQLLNACAPTGSLTVYGSARTGSTAGDGNPTPKDDFLAKAYLEVREMAELWAGETQLSALLTGGGIGAMDAASRGALAGGKVRLDKNGPAVAGVTARILSGIEQSIDEAQARQRFSNLPGGEGSCLYRASSFGLRQTAVATHPPYLFSATVGGVGTDYEILEVLNRLALGELDAKTLHLNFMSPSSEDSTPAAFWQTLIDELVQYHSADNTFVRWLAPPLKQADGVQEGRLLVAIENELPRIASLSFSIGATATATQLLDHEPSSVPEGGEPKFEKTELECGARLAAVEDARDRQVNYAPSRQVFGVGAEPNEVERDVRCSRQAIGKALGLANDAQHPAAPQKAGDSTLWEPRALLVLGSSVPVVEEDRGLAEFFQAFVQELLLHINGQKSDCESKKDGASTKMPLLTPGGGGFLSLAHAAAAGSGVAGVSFFLDHGPSHTIAKASTSPTNLHAYTFTSLGSFEEELIDQARAIVVAPGNLRTAWQLRHALAKLRLFRSGKSGSGLQVPIVLVGPGRTLATDAKWQLLYQRMKKLNEIHTVGNGSTANPLDGWVHYVGLASLAGKTPADKAKKAVDTLLELYPQMAEPVALEQPSS